jgi:hypothetical protein
MMRLKKHSALAGSTVAPGFPPIDAIHESNVSAGYMDEALHAHSRKIPLLQEFSAIQSINLSYTLVHKICLTFLPGRSPINQIPGSLN